MALAVVACKGEKVIEPDPRTQEALTRCLTSSEEKDKLRGSLEDEKAQLERRCGNGTEIVVSIEGNALTVKPGKPGEQRPVDDKAAGEASKQFLDVVAKSRGAIQKCYEQALKKNTSLQAKTITLTVSASFSQAGAYRAASFSPSLGVTFDICMQTLAAKWALPVNSPAMTFKAQVSLTPS